MSVGAPNLAGTVARFASSYTRRRSSGVVKNADGYKVTETTDTTIRAYIHDDPATADDPMPEGLQGKTRIRGYTDGDVRGGDISGGDRPDVIVYMGEQFRVYSVTAWGSGPTGEITWRTFLAAGPVR